MYKKSDFIKEVYRTREVKEILNISYSTIKSYDKNNKLPIRRSATGRRLVFRDDLLKYLDDLGLLYDDTCSNKHDVLYARVSSNAQKINGDLDRQILFLMENIKDLQNPIVMKEVGSGLNDRRAKIQELIDLIEKDEVNRIFVTYKDRLTRFGFNYLDKICKSHKVDIIVVNDIGKIKSIQEELVADMMSLIASFSGKLYDMRSKTNTKGK